MKTVCSSAQHIQRILLASRENLEEARRILPDDVKDIVLPEGMLINQGSRI